MQTVEKKLYATKTEILRVFNLISISVSTIMFARSEIFLYLFLLYINLRLLFLHLSLDMLLFCDHFRFSLFVFLAVARYGESETKVKGLE